MDLRKALEKRRATVETVGAIAGKLYRVTGFVTVKDAGEVALDVNFPVWFTEKPAMSFGGELDSGHSAEDTNFPTISVVVLRWVTTKRGLGFYYTGATLGIVTTGRADQQMIAHWSAEGKALVNPIKDTDDTDGSI